MFFVEIIFYFIWIVIVDASSHSTAATQFEHTQKKIWNDDKNKCWNAGAGDFILEQWKDQVKTSKDWYRMYQIYGPKKTEVCVCVCHGEMRTEQFVGRMGKEPMDENCVGLWGGVSKSRTTNAKRPKNK